MPREIPGRTTGTGENAQPALTKKILRRGKDSTDLPPASIITVNTNELHRLASFLPALFASRGNFELIIADNGSQDGSLEYLSSNYPAVRTLPLGKNIGFCAANNRAAPLARGDLLVFLNPDTRVHPDWLLHLLAPFEDPAVGLTTAKILLMSEPEKINTVGNSVHFTGLTLCRGMGMAAGNYTKPEEVAAVSGAAFAIRRNLFQALGGFDEEFFIYMEETDLSLRSRLSGWKCLTAPESLVWHDYSLRIGPRKIFFQERNRYRMLLKGLRWPTLIVLSPAFLLAELLTWGFVLLNDRAHWRNKLLAYKEIIKNRREISRKRRDTQSLRKARDRDLLRWMGSKLDFSQVTRSKTARLAAVLFNPLFFILRLAALVLVWW